MYIPKYFEAPEDEALAVVRAHPFALLLTPAEGGLPGVTHLPLMLDPAAERPTLIGHVARANPHARALEASGPALAVFSGANAYISPNWYPSKHAGKAAVPTWNYVAVHATGAIRPLPDYSDKRRVIRDLSLLFEGDGPRAWRLDDEPEDFIEKMCGGIVAFALDIQTLEAKAKLSQNRPALDQAGVMQGLASTGTAGAAALAETMSAYGLGHKDSQS